MTEVEVRDVRNYALRGVTDVFPSGKLSVILGPNGAGKTTLIKVIAGLVKYEGSVLFDGEPVDNVPPYMRGVSYVPQSTSLFINMSVWDNIAFGLRARGFDEGVVRERVEALIKMLRLEHVANSYPSSLSGGEARKVALARALAVNPKVLLLDEPFTGLDVEARAVVEQEVMSLIRRLSKTVLLVTHEVGRGLRVADHLHILWRGELLYSGPPRNLRIDEFPEDAAFWLGSVIDDAEVFIDGSLCYALAGDIRIPVKCVLPEEVSGGRRFKVLIPAGGVRVCRRGPIKGVVLRVDKGVRGFKAVVDVKGFKLRVLTPFNLRVGEVVNLRIDEGVVLT